MNDNMPIRGTCRLIRLREVLSICGMSRASFYREVKAHTFPAPVKLSARSVAWLQDEVMEWVAARIEQRASESHIP